MNRNQKIILWGAVGVFAVLVALIIVLIVKNAQNTDYANAANAKADSMRSAMLAKDAEVKNRLDSLDAEQIDFNTFEQMGFQIQNDSILMMYNDLQEKYLSTQDEITRLNKQLEQERKSGKADQATIKKLEAEIATLKDIAKHYLEEMARLKEENDQIKAENVQQKQQIEDLTRRNETVSQNNAELQKEVEMGRQLTLTSISAMAYKDESASKSLKAKDITVKKVKVIGIDFTIAPNSMAAAGERTFYLRIITPDGDVLPGGPSFSASGQDLSSSASATKTYNNEQSSYSIYYNASNQTLVQGDYRLELYEDGRNLGNTSLSVKK